MATTAREALRPLGQGQYTVPSKNNPKVTYKIQVGPSGTALCTCPGYEYQGRCWHTEEAVDLERGATAAAERPPAPVETTAAPEAGRFSLPRFSPPKGTGYLFRRPGDLLGAPGKEGDLQPQPDQMRLVARPGKEPWSPFSAMDKLDDEAILDELEGRVSKVLVYEFRQEGKLIQGLSKAGVDAVGREMAKQGEVLRELVLQWQDLGEEVLFSCQVGRFLIQTAADGTSREILMETVYGVKRQPKHFPTAEGRTGRLNPFWFESGAMKAARNGKSRLIREDLKAAILLEAKKRGSTRTVSPPNPETTSRSPEAEHPGLSSELVEGYANALSKAGSAPASTIPPRGFEPPKGGQPTEAMWEAWRDLVSQVVELDMDAPVPLLERGKTSYQQLVAAGEALRDAIRVVKAGREEG